MHDTNAPPGDEGPRGKPKARTRGVYEKVPGSGVWYVRFQDQKGKIKRKKIGPKALAIRAYKKFTGQVAERREFPEPPSVAPPWDPPFAERIDDYLARTSSTRRDPKRAEIFSHYFSTAPETAGKTMRALTREDFERYRERRLRGDLKGTKRQRGKASAATVNKELSFARAVFYDYLAALEDRGLPPIPNPVRQDRRHAVKDPYVPEAKHRTRFLSETEERRLRAALSPEAWSIVAFALLTGLDRGAQLVLRWEAIDLQTRTINTERRKGQRGQSRALALPINSELLSIMRALPSRCASPWVFPKWDGAGPIDGREFDRLVFRPALKTAGIMDFRWKDLRHTFATRLRLGNVEIQSIRDLLGHTSTRMTERYSHATHTHLREAVDKVALTTDVADDATPRDPATDPALPEQRTAATTA